MISRRTTFGAAAIAVACAAALAACGGGGSSAPANPNPNPNPNPTQTVSTQQVVAEALPSSAIGAVVDPTFGLIGGFTQNTYSQTLAFAPGSQIMIRNGQTGVPHTFGVDSTTGFDANGTALSTTASGGSTVGAGFNTGTIAGGGQAGPFTLAAGTYWIGCAYHYVSNSMRTVLQVSASATPGPQATAPPGTATPAPGGGGNY
ncbi:MAG TPA: hypothetical protein VHT53_07820 [Candidatus Elarobacter sp.]|jgi:hypothetical protein|nr:hypothetical protein [Candidatus Elarobacter sp.]